MYYDEYMYMLSSLRLPPSKGACFSGKLKVNNVSKQELNMCVCISHSFSLSLSLSLFIYIYICIHMCMCVSRSLSLSLSLSIYIYIYIYMDSLRESSVKIGTIQMIFAWPLHKDDAQNREV